MNNCTVDIYMYFNSEHSTTIHQPRVRVWFAAIINNCMDKQRLYEHCFFFEIFGSEIIIYQHQRAQNVFNLFNEG